MKLRKLKKEDASFMLEWMHDEDLVGQLKGDFMSKTIDDCLTFIINSEKDENNVNLAIVNNDDIYQGTVSLKNIKDGNAEFAICIRRCAMHTNVSSEAMKMMIDYAFDKLNVIRVYWFLSKKNTRAYRFYVKNGYKEVLYNEIKEKIKEIELNDEDYIWFLEEK